MIPRTEKREGPLFPQGRPLPSGEAFAPVGDDAKAAAAKATEKTWRMAGMERGRVCLRVSHAHLLGAAFCRCQMDVK